MRVNPADFSMPSPPQLWRDTRAPLIIIVDDDRSVREALSELAMSAGFETACFSSAYELLDADVLEAPGCLILDVRMPGPSGLDLQQHLRNNGSRKPVIFLTGHGDIAMTVKAMKAGAVDFLTKPVRDQALLDAINSAITLDASLRAEASVSARVVKRLHTLTPRERQVLNEVVRGRLNKQIAFDLGISEATAKLHRSNGMRKMEVASVAELIRAWETASSAGVFQPARQPSSVTA